MPNADGALLVGGGRIPAFAERDPATLPWADLGVDLVLESTGVFRDCSVRADPGRDVSRSSTSTMAWYDNEWGFTHQMIREARSTLAVRRPPTPSGTRSLPNRR